MGFIKITKPPNDGFNILEGECFFSFGILHYIINKDEKFILRTVIKFTNIFHPLPCKRMNEVWVK